MPRAFAGRKNQEKDQEKKCMLNHAEDLVQTWEIDPRWRGIVRPYHAEDVERLRVWAAQRTRPASRKAGVTA